MDIRAERTRGLLKRAFEELLEEKPLEAISVSEICTRSTVRRATFYRHFRDRSDFFEWFLTTITDQFLAEIDDDGSELLLYDYVTLMHGKLIDFLESHRSWFFKTMGKNALVEVLDMVMEQVAVGIAQRVEAYATDHGIKLDVPSGFVSLFYTGGMVHTLRLWMLAGKPFPKETLVKSSTDFLTRFLERE